MGAIERSWHVIFNLEVMDAIHRDDRFDACFDACCGAFDVRIDEWF
jgi:hypothetical protein